MITTSPAPMDTEPVGRPGGGSRWVFWVQLFARYFVGIAMIMYAATKFVGTQLTGEPSTYDTPMSSLSGFELTWAYYGFTDIWRMIIGAGELAAALLLFFPRTARLGYVLCLVLLSQIVPMDLIYGIGQGTQAAIFLMVLSLVLLVVDHRAARTFVEAPWPATVPRVARRFGWVKAIVIPVALIGIMGLFVTLARTSHPQTELWGAWQFRGTDGPVRFYVDRGRMCSVSFPRRVHIRPDRVQCAIDEQTDTLTVRTFDDDGRPSTDRFAFDGRYALGPDGSVLTLTPRDGGAALVLDRAPSRFDEKLTEEFADRANRGPR